MFPTSAGSGQCLGRKEIEYRAGNNVENLLAVRKRHRDLTDFHFIAPEIDPKRDRPLRFSQALEREAARNVISMPRPGGEGHARCIPQSGWRIFEHLVIALPNELPDFLECLVGLSNRRTSERLPF